MLADHTRLGTSEAMLCALEAPIRANVIGHGGHPSLVPILRAMRHWHPEEGGGDQVAGVKDTVRE